MSDMVPRNNPIGADNEQGSPTEIELAWLAGVFDGEGWIGLNRARRSNSRHLRYTACSAITTTSPKLADRIDEILTRVGVKHYRIEMPAKMGKDGSWRRRKWNITTGANVQTAKFLSAIRPYLVEKQRQADLVIEYVEWRSALPTRPGGHAENIIVGMKERAEETMRLLREERFRDDPSTTTRLAPSGVMT